MTRPLTILVTAILLSLGGAASAAPKCTKAADCKGPLPRVCMKCSDGTSQCAHHVCTNGTCGTETCPLKAGGGSGSGSGSGGTSKPQCTKATDCRGMLPHLCQKCADGRQDCAHWSCNAGACEQEICPLTSPAPKLAPK